MRLSVNACTSKGVARKPQHLLRHGCSGCQQHEWRSHKQPGPLSSPSVSRLGRKMR
jgi:hypothetical protein